MLLVVLSQGYTPLESECALSGVTAFERERILEHDAFLPTDEQCGDLRR